MKTLTFFCLQNMILFYNVHETCRWLLGAQQISDEVSCDVFNIWCVHLFSNDISTYLWHSVNIFPENFNTNVIPCLLQLKPTAFLSMYDRAVQFIFRLAPNLLDGVEVRTLRRPVHQFQDSSRFFPSHVVPAIVRQ